MHIEKIQQNTTPRVPELIMQALVKAIEDGHIRVGEELPSERDLAEMLGVGRGSLRECLAILEFLGARRRAPGSNAPTKWAAQNPSTSSAG